ncbi:divergent polysaccharide deacetylase family protein [Pseudoalteromonas sp. S16_S37]|uniref:divergent polysaccharide deacetylase family protein n=1 Tax=Pseudoalteromonas sp. S16_S37 TaxID=2720228 RepID=UPI0016819985|nr:divergent polysaccharide deacetylase family protein [Pseudoalteromonas sp. S16_S37]MBD1581728.1 divergent polysaccharide deacetylase family protein [Pseudoalteromonas sp. S16_S37]
MALPSAAKQIAIVIDDIGNHKRDLQLLALPGQLSFSILPHTPYSQQFAYLASKQKKELLLHVPMQSTQDKALGPGALTLDMNKWQLQSTLGHALSTLPQVKGVNNHMGSALTQYVEPMKWTMEVLKKRGLFFLDSRTTEYTQAQNVANLYGVENISRHIFLDNEPTAEALRVQLEALKHTADTEQFAIAIAHPYPETVAFLTIALPELTAQGYEIVPVSQLVELKYIQLAEHKKPKARFFIPTSD